MRGLFLAFILMVGCSTTIPEENLRENTKPERIYTETSRQVKVYTIHCQGPAGWHPFETHANPYDLYGWRSGVWAFKTVKGLDVWATNCFVTD